MPGRTEDTVTITLSAADLALLTEAVSELIYELTHYTSPPSSRGGPRLSKENVNPDVPRLTKLYERLESVGRSRPE